MKTAYFDCFSGISGDMILGALLDAGLEIGDLEEELRKLRLRGFRIRKRKVKRGALAGTKFEVVLEGALRRKTFSPGEMIALVEKSALEDRTRAVARKIFRELARAEARTFSMIDMSNMMPEMHRHLFLNDLLQIVFCILYLHTADLLTDLNGVFVRNSQIFSYGPCSCFRVKF